MILVRDDDTIIYRKKLDFLLWCRSGGYPYKIRLWSLMTLKLSLIMILPFGIGAEKAGETPMWYGPGTGTGI